MKQIKFEMLVRDQVPSMIEKSGRSCVYEVAHPKEVQELLQFKLHETLNQYDQTLDILDLIKSLEVIEAIAKSQGVSFDQVLKLKQEMKDCKGGFEQLYVLKEISYE